MVTAKRGSPGCRGSDNPRTLQTNSDNGLPLGESRPKQHQARLIIQKPCVQADLLFPAALGRLRNGCGLAHRNRQEADISARPNLDAGLLLRCDRTRRGERYASAYRSTCQRPTRSRRRRKQAASSAGSLRSAAKPTALRGGARASSLLRYIVPRWRRPVPARRRACRGRRGRARGCTRNR